MAIATIGRVLGKKGLAYLRKNRKKIKEELDSPEGKAKTKAMLDKFNIRAESNFKGEYIMNKVKAKKRGLIK